MSYTGIFVRQYLGQTPSQTGQGTCSCPDIIISELSQAPNPSVFATQADYGGPAHPPNVALTNPNYVYIRGVPANGYTGGTNFFFYYTQSNLALWPTDWSLFQVTVGTAVPVGAPQNWAWAPAVPAGSIALTGQPLIWTPPNIDTGAMHYCVICWADNSTQANPIPPDLASFGNMASFDELMYFLGQHPNMGWLNTSDNPTPPPNDIYQTSVSTQANPELIYITVNFNNILDGTFMVNLSGDVSYTSGPTPLNVANYQGGFPIPGGVQFGANQTALLQVTWVQGSQPLGPYSNISAQIEHVISSAAMDCLLDISDGRGSSLPIQKKRMTLPDGSLGATESVFILGQQTWNLNFT